MKIVIVLVVGLIVAGLLVAAIGAMLPRTHVASRRASIAASPDAVFAVLRDFSAAPSWRTGIKGVELLPSRDGKVSFRETSRHGAIAYVVDELTPNSRLVTRIADDSLPFGGTWTFELQPAGSGTELRITERGEVKNVIFRFMARFIFGYTTTLETYLKDLGRKFGKPVEVKP